MKKTNAPTTAILILSLLVGFTACKKDPVGPSIDATKMKITSATDFTGTDGDTTSFKLLAVSQYGAVIDGATVSWTNDNTSIGLAASGTGNIATFTLQNKGTTNVVAHIVATPKLNGVSGTPLTITVIVTAAGNTFTMLNSLPLSTGIIPYHWYADAGVVYYGGTPQLKWNTPSDTSALYYGVVYKNNIAGPVVTTFGPGTNYNTPLGNVVGINMGLTDTASVVFKIEKTDPNVTPTSLKLKFIDPSLDHDQVFGGNTASYGALNDSMTVDLSQKVVVTGQFSKIDKAKPLTIYSFTSAGKTTDYYAVPYLFGKFLGPSKNAADVIVTITLSDGAKYTHCIYGGAIQRY